MSAPAINRSSIFSDVKGTMSDTGDSSRESVSNWSLRVGDLSEPVRIDRYLGDAQEIPASRSKIQHALKQGRALVNGKSVKASHKLTGGEQIELTLPETAPSELIPESIPLDIVYEDEQALVVNKPAGMVTHPAIGSRSGTLVHALLGRDMALSDLYGRERAGIVHRLDKNTTGLLVVAKTEAAHVELQRQLQERELKRLYTGIICGHLKQDSGEINMPVGRSLKDRKKMAVTHVASREATTRYTLKERFKSYDLLELELETGRTHQIRVHFAHVGHPIFGDADYGGRESWHKGLFGPERLFGQRLLKNFPRQALHACALSFKHPVSGKRIEVSADLPRDFKELLDAIREHV